MIRSVEEAVGALCDPVSPSAHPRERKESADDCPAVFAFDVLCAPSLGVLTTVMQCLSSLPIVLERAEFAGASSASRVARLSVRFQSDERGADLLRRKLSRLIDVISIKWSTV